MTKKDFIDGMEAGARPFEEKFKKQEEAIYRVSEDLNKKFVDFSDITDEIIDDLERQDDILSSIQRKQIYDLNTKLDILETLDKNEQEFLVAALFTLSNENANEYQRSFIRSVQAYLGIYNPQTRIDLSAIENIENINSQKSILQTIMEFLFLEKGSIDELHIYEDLFSYFNVSKKNMEEIKRHITNIYHATGYQGLAEKYGYVAQEEIVEEIHKEEEVQERTEYYIDEFLKVPRGQEKDIEYKKVHINSVINCEGILNFNHCEILFDEKDTLCEIKLGESATLHFNDCFIQRVNNRESFLISVEQASKINIIDSKLVECNYFIHSQNSCKITITNCEIRDSKSFINEGWEVDLLLDQCDIIRPQRNFINIQGSLIGEMRNCTGLIGSQYIDKEDEFYSTEYIFNFINDENNFKIKDCTFKKVEGLDEDVSRVKESQLRLFQVKADFDHCTFIYINEPIEIPYQLSQSFDENITIEYCSFEKCSNMIRAHSNLRIEYCTFANGYGYVCEGTNSTHIYVGYCNFNNLAYGDGKYGGTFGIQNFRSLLAFRANQSRSSMVEKCQFNNILLGEGFLIEQDLLYKKDLSMIVEDCIFENCFTHREDKEIIKEYDRIYRKFSNKGKDILAVRINNCRGLEEVNLMQAKF